MTTNFNCQIQEKICDSIPTVDFKKEWHAGGTGYIDGIRPSDAVFASSPVVKFVDAWDRSAIAFKYTVSCPEPFVDNKEYAVAAFQRTTEGKKLFVYGGHYNHPEATGIIVNPTWLENLLLNHHQTFTHFYGDYNETTNAFESVSCDIIIAGAAATASTETREL